MHDEENATPVPEGNQPEPLPSEGSILMDAPRKAPERFDMTPQLLEDLKIFRPADGQDPLDKWNEICDDLTANVTHIYGRPDFFKLYDLVFHSVLSFKMFHEYIDRGWLTALVIGDTGQGKSWVAEKLIEHYGVGTLSFGGTDALTGLLYYREKAKFGGQLRWGVIPENDEGLVVVDSFHHTAEKGRKMILKTSAQGFIETTGKQTCRADTRTRLILLACPVSGQRMNEITGIQAIKDLLKKRELISSVDLVDLLQNDDVPLKVLNSRRTGTPDEHRYTSQLCNALVFWTWTRTRDQIVFPKETWAAVYRARDFLARKYPPSIIPLCDVNLRHKVARMAAALAGRLFSSSDGETLHVTPAHVQAIVRFLDWLYAKPSFGWP